MSVKRMSVLCVIVACVSVCSASEIGYRLVSEEAIRNTGYKDVTTMSVFVMNVDGQWPQAARERIEENAKREVRNLLPGIQYVSLDSYDKLNKRQRPDLLLVRITVRTAGGSSSTTAAAYLEMEFVISSPNASSSFGNGLPLQKNHVSSCWAVCGFEGSRYEEVLNQAISGMLKKLTDSFWESR
jgi:hypothetical protein